MDKERKKGEKNMSTVLAKDYDLKAKLNKISNRAQPLTGKKDMIELDPKNPHHKEWFETDKYKEK
ncbi:MAG: hypothetical protein PHT78_14485 [Desulfitobacteriaceae bacterium]|nr:hypothetical protein [Desulfitobacteriaceae bacterium]MDD4754420.1 hypothetical protein [Desulfitobacteriaceae bacterium]